MKKGTISAGGAGVLHSRLCALRRPDITREAELLRWAPGVRLQEGSAGAIAHAKRALPAPGAASNFAWKAAI